MTRQELLLIIIVLYGSQAEAVRRLGISKRTMAGWGVDTPVPPAVAALLRDLYKLKPPPED